MKEQAQFQPDNRKLIDTTPFSVSARVAMQLGRESISSSVTAIIELVKNAYDADADEVKVRFGGLNSAEATMVIEDDGKGMTSDELKANWMVIGTANKAQGKKTANKNRVLTGEKGLGRLGLDRLCNRTRVQSITFGAANAVELDVDWGKYETAQSRLEEVTHPIFEIENLNTDPLTGEVREYRKGTRLILEGIKDAWNEPAIADLHGELSLLISPFHAHNDFQVKLDTGGAYSKFDGIVTPDSAILDNAYWKVVGTIKTTSESGIVEIRMSSRRHNMEFHQEEALWREFAKGEGEIPKCGDVKFEFYFFHRGELEGPTPTETMSLPKLNQFLRSNQGIRIYRDGFRVKPYGEPNGDGDWLKLGYRRTINPEGVKQKGNWRMGYNQVVGAVFLTREKNATLIDQTNREGLVMGEAFRHLYIFADKVLSFFEKQHQKFERLRVKQEPPPLDPVTAAQNSAAAADAALEEIEAIADKLLPAPPGTNPETQGAPTVPNFQRARQTLKKSVKELEERVREADTRRQQTEREKNTLANLASLGILAACFGHETCGWAGTVQTNAGWLHRNLKSHLFMVTPDLEEEILQILKDIGTDSKKLQTFASFALGNIRPDKRRQRVFCIKEAALDVFKAFAESLESQKSIQTDITDVPSHECPIRAYRIDWESILANLITNAMWAITKHNRTRKIQFSIKPTENSFVLTFEDSGFGLEAGTEEQIFDAGFSTRRNNNGEQEGTGMGLFIVKSFVEENTGGTVKAFSKGVLGGAKFVITVPKASQPTEGKI